MNPLFEPYKLNDQLTLNNRIIMAPLTRCMADENLVPTQASVAYYERRADAGLIISEAILVSADGQGYPNTPGLFTTKQVAGWKKVTERVHAKGGKIFAQLWHTGRVAHPSFFGGNSVIAPSALAVEGTVPRMRHLTYLTPTPATKSDILRLTNDFKQAAKNAMASGFDGVEIHGANGYLIDQFLHYDSNQRTDEYGGTPENMSRFALEIVDAVSHEIGEQRTALRLAPGAFYNIKPDPRDRQVFDYLLSELDNRALAYLHLSVIDHNTQFEHLDGTAQEYIRNHYNRTLMCAGSYDPEKAVSAIDANRLDLVAIGRGFIANPDYISKVKTGDKLKEYDETMLAELI